MRAVAECFEAALLTNADVLISGEAGTGRELMARAIHRASTEGQRGAIGQLLCESTRSFVGDRPFIHVDCSSTTDLETELFGLPQASRTASAGLDSIAEGSQLHRAIGGTLFLRQLHEMPTRHQTRLARVLRDREVWLESGRIPAKLVSVSARVIAAVDERADDDDDRVAPELRRRLDSTRIQLPPLRERREDIPGLVRQLLEDLCASMRLPPKKASRHAIELLAALPWRGNLRELRGLLRAVAVKGPSRLVRLRDVLDNVRLDGTAVVFSGGGTLKEARDRFEREYVATVLQRHDGHMAEAATALGIQRTNLYRKVRQLAVDRRISHRR